MAAKAALRPFQTTARSASDWATRISHAPHLRQMSLDLLHQSFNFGCRAVQFHQQQSAAVRISGVHGGFGCLDGEIVHHLDGGGQHARGNDLAHRSARFVGGVESGQQRLDDFGFLHDAQHDFGRDTQRAFGSDKNSRQIVSGTVDGAASEVHQRSVGQNHLQRQHVGGGESILQTVRAAGVLRHVAADAAHRLRGWIGSIKETVGSNPLRDVRVDHARLDHYARVREVNFQDAVHARQADDDAAFDWAARHRSVPCPNPGPQKGSFREWQMRTIACTSAVDSGSRTAGGRTRRLVSPSHS